MSWSDVSKREYSRVRKEKEYAQREDATTSVVRGGRDGETLGALAEI